MQNNSDYLNQILELIYKWWVWLFYIAIGMIGKFSHDLVTGKKLSWTQVFSSIGIALFVGFISSAICMYNDWQQQGQYIVPICTLLSEKLVLALFAVDYKKMMAEFAQYWADKMK